MIVSDQSLEKLLADRRIVVEPLEERQVQPASIDLRLGEHSLKVDENSIEAIGRIGLFIQNAGWVDPGSAGTITPGSSSL